MQEVAAILLSVASCVVLVVMWVVSRPPARGIPPRPQRSWIEHRAAPAEELPEVERVGEEAVRPAQPAQEPAQQPQPAKQADAGSEGPKREDFPKQEATAVRTQEAEVDEGLDELLPLIEGVKSSYFELMEELRRLRSALSGEKG
ncbi:MAG: hypothetical protein ABDH63_06895 [Candidatus Caldarchaeales archaeon]